MEKAQTPPFDQAAFKEALMKRIAEMTPKTLEDADNFKDNNNLDSVKGELDGKVKEEKTASQKPLEEKAKETPDTSGIEPKPVSPLPPTKSGPLPGEISAQEAVPKSKGKDEIEAPMKAESQSIDQQMTEAKVTDEQLAQSNEPEFQSALKAKKEAKTNAKESPQKYRQFEQVNLDQAQAEAVKTAQEKTQEMHGDRTSILTDVTGQQVETKGKDEQERTKVAGDIDKIYQGTKTNVEKILSDLDGEVNKVFDKGAAEAKQAFEDYVDKRMKAYKDKRYSGFWGPGRWLWDKLAGMPSEVNVFYEEGRNIYLKKMDGVINQVVTIVSKNLTAAKAEVSNGKKKVWRYFKETSNCVPGNSRNAGCLPNNSRRRDNSKRHYHRPQCRTLCWSSSTYCVTHLKRRKPSPLLLNKQ